MGVWLPWRITNYIYDFYLVYNLFVIICHKNLFLRIVFELKTTKYAGCFIYELCLNRICFYNTPNYKYISIHFERAIIMAINITPNRILGINYNNGCVVVHKPAQLTKKSRSEQLKRAHKQRGGLA